MIPATAWGELLIVGSVPAAAAILIVAAMLARRHRRLAYAVAGLAVVVLAGFMALGRHLGEPLNEIRKRQKGLYAPLRVGWTREEVAALLGEPDLLCPGEGAHVHKVMGTRQLVRGLYASTAERWIYVLPESADRERPDCRPHYADGEVGFNAEGRVIWYIELTDDTFLTF
jgi:hypothetical protein